MAALDIAARRVLFPAEDSRKMGRECREGLGRPVFRKGELSASQYITNAHIRDALGCTGYVKYDFENRQFCCSATPATAGELIEFLLMMMETMSNTVLNTKMYNRAHRDYIVQLFNYYIKKVPAGERQRYLTRYDSYLEEIDKNRRTSVALENRLVQDEEEINWEHAQNVAAKKAQEYPAWRKAAIIKEANTAYDALPPFGPINYGFRKSKKSVRKSKKSVRKSAKKTKKSVRKSAKKSKKSVKKTSSRK